MASDATPAMIPSALSVADLKTININEAPRIRDMALADRLGFTDQHMIRRLIQRNRTELESYGEVSVTVTETTAQGGRPGTEFWLLEEQALVICALSRTPAAMAVRRQIIIVFMEWRRAQVRATDSAGQPLPLTEQEIMVALAFRRQVQGAVEAQVERELAARRFELGAAASIAVTQILTGTLTYDIDTKRFTHRDNTRAGGAA